MGMCYRLETKLPPPDTIKLNLLFRKQEPLNQQYESRSIEPENSYNSKTPSEDSSENNNQSSSYSSYYSKSSCYQESKNNRSSLASSQFKSSQIQNDQNKSIEVIQNSKKTIVFPIQVYQDNNENIENISDDDAAEYSKASSYHTLTQFSRKSLKQVEGKQEAISQEKFSRDPSKTIKTGKSGKSFKTFKSLDQLEKQEKQEDQDNIKKTIKTIAEKRGANQFLIVVTDETSTQDMKYMMVNVKEQNMQKIQEDEGEEEECKLDLNDNETNPIQGHPIIAKKQKIFSEQLQDMHYETEQTIKTFESFYSAIKNRNSEKLTDNSKTASQKKSTFAFSASKVKDIEVPS